MLEHVDPIDRLRVHADVGLDVESHAAIVDNVRRRLETAGDTARRRWNMRWKSIIPAGIATIAVAGGTAAAVGVWNPSLGDDQRGRPTTATSDVPAEQLQRFGVLRREATAADRDAVTESALRYLDARLAGVRVDHIRAVDAAGKRYLVVPVERDYDGRRDALCLLAPESGSLGLRCQTTRQVLTGDGVVVILPTPSQPASNDPERPAIGRATSVGIVPDGVATVTAGHGDRATVHDNLFALKGDPVDPADLVWRDSTGAAIDRP